MRKASIERTIGMGLRMPLAAAVGVAATFWALAPASAAPPAPPRATVIDNLFACRGKSDPAERLACFDQASKIASDALGRHDLMVIDRQAVRRTRSTLFGLSLPRLDIFGNDDKDEVKQIESTVLAAREASDGYIFNLKDGSQWAQTDGHPIALPPEPGDKVVVTKAALGSFILMLGHQPGVRVKRIR